MARDVVRSSSRHRRLLVRADTDTDGGYLSVRDVSLQSSVSPPGLMTDSNTTDDLFAIGLPCPQVVDLILWAQAFGVHVVYEPEGNMRGWFSRRRIDQGLLFDVG